MDFLEILRKDLQASKVQRELTPIMVATEEILVNILHHSGLRAQDTIQIVCKIEGEKCVELSFTDCGKAYDLGQVTTLESIQSIDKRPLGGCGIHLLRQFSDFIDCQRMGGKNVVKLIKFLK